MGCADPWPPGTRSGIADADCGSGAEGRLDRVRVALALPDDGEAAAAPWPACAPSWWNPDRAKELAIQVMWMVLVTLGLALGGILGLAAITQITAWARRR